MPGIAPASQAGTVPVQGASNTGSALTQGAVPNTGATPDGAGSLAAPVGFGQTGAVTGAAPGSAVGSTNVPVGYVTYNGQLITYQQYQQLLASQQQMAASGAVPQTGNLGSTSNVAVPAGYVNLGGQLITQQQYAQLLSQAGNSVNGVSPGGSLGASGQVGAIGAGGTAGSGSLGTVPAAGLNGMPGANTGIGSVQKRDDATYELRGLARRQVPGSSSDSSTQTQQAGSAAPPAQIMVCVNGDTDVAPIKFDVMTGVRIIDHTVSTSDKTPDISNLPNYKRPWMPFLPTQSMWEEQQILMLAQEHQIQYSTDVGPPPSP